MHISMALEGDDGPTYVMLDTLGDHVVVRIIVDKSGAEREITLPAGSFAWERAVERAQRGAVFL